MKILAGGATDVGKVRSNNEDAFLVDSELGLFAVADGMGGYSAGEVASHLALETLHSVVVADRHGEPEALLRRAIQTADEAVLAEAKANPERSKMGTTLTALLVDETHATIGHVGDSRLYRVRWGEVDKLTEDHTAVAELLRAGLVKEEEAPGHPWAHVLSRVVGREGEVDVETHRFELAPGDRFLLCSDGFSDSLRDPRWLDSLSDHPPDESAKTLVARAVELDGGDNATAVVVAIGDEEDRERRRSGWQRFRDLVRAKLDELRG